MPMLKMNPETCQEKIEATHPFYLRNLRCGKNEEVLDRFGKENSTDLLKLDFRDDKDLKIILQKMNGQLKSYQEGLPAFRYGSTEADDPKNAIHDIMSILIQLNAIECE